MPYIKQERRVAMDEIVDKMIGIKVDHNDLALILFNYCEKNVKPSYNNYKNFIGEISECVTEIVRRSIASPYGEGEFGIRPQKPQRMNEINNVISLMVEKDIKVDGDLNYVVFKYCTFHSDHVGYDKMVSMLNATIKQIRRGLLASYEESKIKENGDVEK